MNVLKIYQSLKANHFSEESANEFIEGLKENQDAATKGDLKNLEQSLKSDMKDLELKLTKLITSQNEMVAAKIEMVLKEMNAMTMRFVAIVALLGVVFKIAEMYLK